MKLKHVIRCRENMANQLQIATRERNVGSEFLAEE
jgi:hypothetical protein